MAYTLIAMALAWSVERAAGDQHHVVTTVSGEPYWMLNMDDPTAMHVAYANMTSSPGDRLHFVYNAVHDVWKMPSDMCSAAGAIELANASYGGGPDAQYPNMYVYTVTDADLVDGVIYFACSWYPAGTFVGIYSHCQAGQQLTVNVVLPSASSALVATPLSSQRVVWMVVIAAMLMLV
jgi:hypothetical protein